MYFSLIRLTVTSTCFGVANLQNQIHCWIWFSRFFKVKRDFAVSLRLLSLEWNASLKFSSGWMSLMFFFVFLFLPPSDWLKVNGTHLSKVGSISHSVSLVLFCGPWPLEHLFSVGHPELNFSRLWQHITYHYLVAYFWRWDLYPPYSYILGSIW